MLKLPPPSSLKPATWFRIEAACSWLWGANCSWLQLGPVTPPAVGFGGWGWLQLGPVPPLQLALEGLGCSWLSGALVPHHGLHEMSTEGVAGGCGLSQITAWLAISS